MRLRVVVLACVLGLFSCKHAAFLGPWGPELHKRWVATEPIQCLGNPWEQDWLKSHDGDYASYPKDPTRPGLEPEEIEIIKDFYRRQGVVVFEVDTRPKYLAVCAACLCPEGHTLYLRVRLEDLETMLALGYRQESPH